jgi:hypothetical protein
VDPRGTNEGILKVSKRMFIGGWVIFRKLNVFAEFSSVAILFIF